MKKDLVSVVIPVYNDPMIIDAVNSCLRQTYPAVEVIVVDDGSKPVIRSLVAKIKDQRVKYIRQKKHTNANVCRNLGIREASGEYVAFLDSDDLFMSEHLSRCFESIGEADGLYGGIVAYQGNHRKFDVPAELPTDEHMANYLLRKGYGAATSTLFVRRGCAGACGWDESLLRHQDYDFVVRFAACFTWNVLPRPTVIYRITPAKAEIDLSSCIRFYDLYKSEIAAAVRENYLAGMLRMAGAMNAPEDILSYYSNELSACKMIRDGKRA